MRIVLCTLLLAAACTSKDAPKDAPKVIKGTIDVKGDLKAKVEAADTIYVIARKGQGGPPLAVKKLGVTPFPIAFELTERDVMMGGPFEGDVDLSVRIDKDGDAMTKNPGDLIGNAAPGTKVVDTAATVLIDQSL